VRILLANHTSGFSGAEVSLLRLIAGLQPDHDLAVACPAGGPLTEAIERIGLDRYELPNVDVSLRLHPLHTSRGLLQLASAARGLARAATRFRAEVVHANTIRTGLLAASPGSTRVPVVVRAHEHPPATRVGRSVRAVIVHSAGAVAAVSDYTMRQFNEGLRQPAAMRVYNSIDHRRLDPERVVPAHLRREFGIPPQASLLGEIAQITPWKNQETAVRALALLRRAGVNAHLMIVGEVAFAGKRVRYDNHAYLASLERLVRALGIADAVHFVGQRHDIPAIFAALDLSLLPSWEEPFGLATVESMAMGTPPLVSSVGAGSELVVDGVSGRVLPPREPGAWARAAESLLRDRDSLAQMARRARAAAGQYRDEIHAYEMVQVYEATIRAGRSPARSPARAERRRLRGPIGASVAQRHAPG
jgi:L-malate glycosyltransferase